MSLYEHPKSQYWWFRFQVRGVEIRGSTGKTDRREAEIEERRLRAKAEETAPARTRGVGPLSALKSADVARAVRRGASPEIAERTLRTTWAPILFHFGEDYDISKLNAAALDEYVDARRAWENHQGHKQKIRRVRGQTIVRELQALKRASKIALRRGWIRGVLDADDWPTPERDPPDPKLRGKLHSLERVREVLADAKKDIRETAFVAATVGLRWGEIQKLEWSWLGPSDVPGVPAVCRLPSWGAKTRKERSLGVPPATYEIVKGRHEAQQAAGGSGPLFPHSKVSQYLSRFAKRRGYEQAVTLRDLRHFFSSVGLQGTGDMRAVQEAMGHTRYTTTELYQHSTLARTASVGVAVAAVLNVVTPTPAHRKRERP
jgi:integrase